MAEYSGSARNVVQIGQNHGPITFEAPERPVPWEIEPFPGVFVDRAEEMDRLRARAGIAVLTGLPGVGKSTLARRFAELSRDRFPGGQLLVEVADYTVGGEVDVLGMMGSCLAALGVAEEHQPSRLADRVKLFRTRTAAQPCLVMIDGATEPAQVRNLLPRAPGSLVLATTGADLSELDLAGATFHELRGLGAEHSRELFVAVAGEPSGTELVGYADGLPLAIAIMGSLVRRLHETTLAELSAEIADDRRRLHTLSLGGCRVSAAFSSSYQRLPDDARLLYRRLSLLPGPDFTGAVAAALVLAGGALMGRLADAHLL
ncbi:AAA family ATPase, partial [Actinocorallia lasiicapitis]